MWLLEHVRFVQWDNLSCNCLPMIEFLHWTRRIGSTQKIASKLPAHDTTVHTEGAICHQCNEPSGLSFKVSNDAPVYLSRNVNFLRRCARATAKYNTKKFVINYLRQMYLFLLQFPSNWKDNKYVQCNEEISVSSGCRCFGWKGRFAMGKKWNYIAHCESFYQQHSWNDNSVISSVRVINVAGNFWPLITQTIVLEEFLSSSQMRRENASALSAEKKTCPSLLRLNNSCTFREYFCRPRRTRNSPDEISFIGERDTVCRASSYENLARFEREKVAIYRPSPPPFLIHSIITTHTSRGTLE